MRMSSKYQFVYSILYLLPGALLAGRRQIPSDRLTLHSTKLCTKFKIFRKELFFGTNVTSKVLLSISQNLKVTGLQGCTKTKL